LRRRLVLALGAALRTREPVDLRGEALRARVERTRVVRVRRAAVLRARVPTFRRARFPALVALRRVFLTARFAIAFTRRTRRRAF
jgi:hypothetical protein